MTSRSNVTSRSSSRARPIRGAPRPMDGHAYTLEEIDSLTAEQARWVEDNPDFEERMARFEKGGSDGELPFHDANQHHSPAPVLSGSTGGNRPISNSDPTPSSENPPSNVPKKKPVHHMEVDRRERLAPGNHHSNPIHASVTPGLPANPISLHEPRAFGRTPHNPIQTPAHLGFARPNVADYGPLPAQVYVTDVNKAMKEWSREIVPNFTGTDHGSAEEWLRKLSIELTVRFVHPGIWAQVGIRCLAGKARRDFDSSVRTGTDPRTWDTFADWLIKHNPDTSNTEVVANAYRRLRQMPNERAVDFYNRFRLWQLDAETYDYNHHETTGFVERLEPHLRQRVQTAISTAMNLGHPMTFEQIAMCAIDDDRRHQNNRGMNGVSRAPFRAPTQAPPPQASTSAYQAGSSSGVQRRHGSGTQGGKKKADYSIRTCYNCGGQGHISAKCTEPKSERQLKYESDLALSTINSLNA
ncbi:hypothetical protein H4Q26_004201 [Puccinia striiformis f. sp. tritici PST-130]|nr:hypothetical protein H4Q26_004201 [Puccinia striiformis f. sp. tritici PST-130]